MFTNRDQAYYVKILNVTNGLLLPGGYQSYNDSTEYSKAAQIIWDLTYGPNGTDHQYPIWGTCLGLEVLVHMLDQDQTFTDCDAKNLANTLTMDDNVQKNSKMFNDSGDVFNVSLR